MITACAFYDSIDTVPTLEHGHFSWYDVRLHFATWHFHIPLKNKTNPSNRFNVTCHPIILTWRHITTYHVTPWHITPRHIKERRIISHKETSHVTWGRTTSHNSTHVSEVTDTQGNIWTTKLHRNRQQNWLLTIYHSSGHRIPSLKESLNFI